MKSNVLKFVFFYLVISFSLKAQNRLILEAPSVQTSLKTGVLEQIEQYELFELNTQALHTFARNRTKDTFGVRIRFSDTHDWDIILQPAKVHDSDFKFMMSTGEIVEAEKNITYEGYLKNDQKTKVRMTISDNYVFGLILDADRYVFETVNRTPNRTTNDLVTVYKSNLLVAGSPACGRLPETQIRENENLNTMPLNSPSSPTEPLVSNPVSPVVAANLLASTYCVKLGITLDWQGLAVAGGSVAKFNADLQTIINVVNGYYAVFNVKYELNPAYIITASPNPWKDAPGNESQLTTNFLGWAFPNLTPKNYNCALLFTGTNMNGISYAYYGQMCPSSSYRYGEIDYKYVQPITQRANITTHELGHLWGAQHTAQSSIYIMSPSIWDGTLQWDPAATKVINTGVTTTFNSCLPNCSSFIVNWTNPIDGQIFTNLNPVSLSANATVTTGSVKQVEFFVGNTSVGIDSTAPYTLNWTPPAYGSYALKAVATNNLANTTTATLNINVQMPPSCGTVTGLTSSGITASSATVAWSALSGANNYTVDYKLGTATTWTNLTAATTALSANLTALTAGTLYNWRVKANCTGATGAYATNQFTTTVPASCGRVTGLTSSAITASSATVAWSALSGANNYTVDYKLGTATTWTNLTAATTVLSANLTALTAGTLYNWRVKANCTGATGAYVTAQFTTTSTPNLVPAFDHIVVVIGENTSASSVFGSSNAPYINALAAGGAKFTNSYALSHPSQPNYIQFYSGNNQGITNDNTITTKFTTANLGKELINAGKTYTTFSEGLPSVGYDGSSSGLYARKHNPAANWMGNGTNQIPTTTNQPFTAFPTNFSNLPSVSFVVPNLCSDGHDVCSPVNNSVLQYDKWVQTNLNAYKNWAVANNSLLIVTYDEDDFTTTNKIATVFYGAHVLQGVYAQTINHYNVLRTIEDAFRLTTHAGSAATSTQIGYCWTSLAGIKNQSNSQAYGQISSLLGTANIYPNPVTSLLQVDMTDLNTATSIKVIDVNGKVVLIHPINEYDTQVDVSQLTKGFYILFINEVSGKQLSTSKFIKE